MQSSHRPVAPIAFLTVIRRKAYRVCNYYRCTVGQKKAKRPYYFNINYRTKMKLVLIIIVLCFKMFLNGASTWGSLLNFNFLKVNPQFFQRNRKVHLSNCVEINFHSISNISLRDIRRRSYS